MREEKRSEIIHDALNMLDDEMIEEVGNLRGGVAAEKAITSQKEEEQVTFLQQEPRPWRKWVALAASVCVVIVVGGVWNASVEKGSFNQTDGNLAMEDAEHEKQEDISDNMTTDAMDMPEAEEMQGNNPNVENGATVTIPAMKVTLGKEDGVEADMIGFFIYQGRCYVQTCDYMTKDVVGNYVCTTTGLIDEWTTEDGYVDLAGSIEEKFYEVKGIDPEFMLCTVYENGVVETFIHNNGITLDKGSELLVDRLGLDDSYQKVGFLTREEWENQYKTKQEPTAILEEQREIFDKFIASFNEGDFVYAKSLGMNRDVIYGSDAIYHLYITTEEGVPLHFLLLGDGYVSLYGLDQVCVQVDEDVYDQIESIFKKR